MPRSIAGIPTAQWAVAGQTAYAVDIDTRLGDAIPWVIGSSSATHARDHRLRVRVGHPRREHRPAQPAAAAAAFGVLTLTFQHTWAQRLLDFTSTGAVINWIPLFTFAVLFGLSIGLPHLRDKRNP